MISFYGPEGPTTRRAGRLSGRDNKPMGMNGRGNIRRWFKEFADTVPAPVAAEKQGVEHGGEQQDCHQYY